MNYEKSQWKEYLLFLITNPKTKTYGGDAMSLYNRFMSSMLVVSGCNGDVFHSLRYEAHKKRYPKYPTNVAWPSWYEKTYYPNDEEYLDEVVALIKEFTESDYFSS